MTTTVKARESAKILTFPARARKAAAPLSGEPRPVAELAARRASRAASSAAWYHEAAIAEAEDEPHS
jgi:hypothetical protein